MAISRDVRSGILKRAVQLLIVLLIIAASLFLSAGRLDWWNGWLFLGLYATMIVCTGAILMRKDPELIAERASLKKDAKSWDKLLAGVIGLYGPMVVWIVAGLHARYHWPGSISGPVQAAAGVALIVAGYSLVSWAMASNRFFSAVVRIQKDRDHCVVSGGPYHYVRHPGYVGMIVSTLGTPLLLGSAPAFAPAVVTIGVAVLRTALEDRTLQLELEGYTGYAQRVKWRLLPGLW